MEKTNTDLYTRTFEKLKEVRSAHATVSNRVIDNAVQLENIKKQLDELMERTAVNDERFRTLDDTVRDSVNQIFTSQVEPLFQEFLTEIANLETELKILKQTKAIQPPTAPQSVPQTDLETASVKSIDTRKTQGGLSLRRKV